MNRKVVVVRYLRKLVKMYNSGMTLRQIAKKFGCSYQRIHQILVGHVKFRSRGYGRTLKLQPFYDKIVKMVKEGYTRCEIAKKFGISRTTFHKTFKRWGLKTVRQRHTDIEKLFELYRKGWRIKRICKRLDITHKMVYYYLHKFGVKLRGF